MKTTVIYLGYAIYNKIAKKIHLFEKQTGKFKTYGGKKFVDSQSGNDRIRELIETGKPFMVARYGANELAIMRQIEEKKIKIRKSVSPNMIDQFCNCAGFFPKNEEKIAAFAYEMKENTEIVDLMGVWFNPMEDYFIKRYNRIMKTTPLTALEPWYHNNPWSKSLEGKKVLVIHPFAETIAQQYKRRAEIWPNDILPDMRLYTLKAVQTIAGSTDNRFKTWFDALEYMFQEAIKIDFDIAIIGCGAYGFPLAARLKMEGKQTIHLGGATQILFGIKGKRWDEMPQISRFYNDAWVRPNGNEIVTKGISVEGGCYW